MAARGCGCSDPGARPLECGGLLLSCFLGERRIHPGMNEAPRKTVLVVDAFAMNRSAMKTLLLEEGFAVREAADGVEAMEILARAPIDAVISDILMPNMDGYGLCAEVRRSERFRDVPFIVYTSTYASPSDESRALELGADRFIRKPAQGSVLVNAVRELVSGPRRIHAAIAPQADPDLTTGYAKRLVEKLEEKNEELQAVIRAAPVAIVSFDQAGRVTAWNPAAERIFGWSEAEVLGQRPPHVGAEDWGEFERLRQRVHAGETIVGLEVRRCRRDGTKMDLDLNAAPIKDAEGNIVGKLAVLADISRRKRAEVSADRSRVLHKALFDDFPALIWQSGRDAKCCYFNRTWLEFRGRALEQELGDGWTQGVHPDDLEKTVASYLDAFHARRPFEREYRLRRHDGEYRNILDHGRPFPDPAGLFAGYVGSCHDITDRKRAEERLARSEGLLAEAQALAQMGSWEWDVRNDIVIWSDELYRMTELKPQERPVSYDYFLTLVHPDDRSRVDQVIRQAFIDCQRFEYEYRTALPSGVSRTYHVKGVVLCDDQNRPARLHGTMQDITEQSAAREALRRSEERFRQLAENIDEVIWIRKVEGWRLEFVSASYAKVWRRSIEDFDRQPDQWKEAIHPEDRDHVARCAEQLPTTGEYDMTYRVIWPDGSIRWIHDRAIPVRDPQGRLIRVAGIAEDITERKRAEQQVENFAEMLKILTNRLFEVQEDERRHLARELHDEIGQSLTAAKMGIELARQLGDPVARTLRLDDSLAVIDHLLQSVRALSIDLRPALLDEVGLAAALRAHSESQAARGGFALRLVVEETMPRCHSAIEIACFRVAQEALTNILRHARARNVKIELRRGAEELVLRVRDDGVGFDVAAANARVASGGSFGLLSMRERVNLAGGNFVCKSSAGHGAEIQATFRLTASRTEIRHE
jgi:PAS domain S-box-containing protein